MLIFFSAENFRSINEPIELNLKAAPRLRRHVNHVRSPSADQSLKILKSAVLYGANASGKSNILKAIKYARDCILSYAVPNKPIDIEPFLLTENPSNESSFYFEFIINKCHFGYGFKLDKTKIIEESLYTLSTKGEKCVFEREYDSNTDSHHFTSDYLSEENKSEFEYLNKYTPNNRLFFNECNERDVFDKLGLIGNVIESAYDFFKYFLIIIFPDTKYMGLARDLSSDDECNVNYIDVLKQFDTGVDGVKSSIVDNGFFDSDFLENVIDNMDRDSRSFTAFTYKGKDYQASLSDDGELTVYKFNSIHKLKSGKTIHFPLANESDGTLRLLDLLPAIESVPEFSHTYIIDEFDRSLHPNIARAFIDTFIRTSKDDCDDQLIVTTHQAELLDNDLLRRDEIWFVQKEWDQSSHLYSLNDYSTRFDTDIQKAYLSGKYGAIPQLVDDSNREA